MLSSPKTNNRNKPIVIIYNENFEKFTMNLLKDSNKDNYKALYFYLLNQIEQDRIYAYFIFKEVKYKDVFSGDDISSNAGYENTITSCFEMIYIYDDYTYDNAYVGVFHERIGEEFKKTGDMAKPATETDEEKEGIMELINTLKEKHKIEKF